jgi:cold shock CspA family protein/ribosome-associated translation inhibitor RaiA
METPLEITFHNVPTSDAIKDEIRKRVGKLEKIYGRFKGCRVALEAPHQQHRTGNVYEVHIEMRLPRRKLVVSREPHHTKEGHARGDLLTPLRDAFKAAEAQLRAFAEERKGEVKAHPTPVLGRITELPESQDFGYLTTNDGTLLYFHRNSVMNGGFEELKLGDTVEYVEAMGDTGPTASKVWLATGPAGEKEERIQASA